MTDDVVQLPVDSVGKKMRTINQTVGANVTEAEVVHVASATNASGIVGVVQTNGDQLITTTNNFAMVGASLGYVLDPSATSWDRMRSVTAASGTTGLGVLGAGGMAFDYSGGSFAPIPTTASGSTVPIVSASGNIVGIAGSGAGVQLMPGNATIDSQGNVGILAVATTISDGVHWRMLDGVGPIGDGNAGNNAAAVGPVAYNGATFDRIRTAPGASGTTGTGLLGAGMMAQDGSNFYPLTSPNAISGGTQSGIGILAAQATAFDQSGKAYRPLTTIASGSSTIKVGNVWKYLFISPGVSQLTTNSGAWKAFTITSGYTFLHSIQTWGFSGSLFRGFGDAVSGDWTYWAAGSGVISDNGGMGQIGNSLNTIPLDIEVYSGLVLVYASGNIGLTELTIFYKQAPLN